MTNEIKLGQVITGHAERDAIHVALAPLVAGVDLEPGQHVGLFADGTASPTKPWVGIVDPFLTQRVEKGQRFYVMLYQNTVTSLKHEWQHPLFHDRRPIKNFDGYEIDVHGAVWSRRDSGLSAEFRPMNSARMKSGHMFVRLYNGKGVSLKRYIHRLVLETFICECPEGMECRHLDGNPANNDLMNLAWGTPSENQADREIHGTSNAGENNGMAKLTSTIAAEIRQRYAAGGISQEKLGKEYGISGGTVLNVVKNRTYKSKPTPQVTPTPTSEETNRLIQEYLVRKTGDLRGQFDGHRE